MQRLCVFCGSSAGTNSTFAHAARRLGELLAGGGTGLVYGGGRVGLMGVLADAVLQRGGEVIGVIPQSLKDRELAHPLITTLHVVETMHQRKALMADLADGFAALPGGFGTADELFEILTWAQLGMHARPIGLLNVAGYFNHLLAWLEHAVAEGFLQTEHRGLLLEASHPKELLDLLENFQPAQWTEKWIQQKDR